MGLYKLKDVIEVGVGGTDDISKRLETARSILVGDVVEGERQQGEDVEEEE